MANITRDEEEKVKDFQKRTGGGCIDQRETVEERIAANEAEIKANRRRMRELVGLEGLTS